jgi:hypothetical protein
MSYSINQGTLKENQFRRDQSDNGEHINVYASGNGSLSFNVSDQKGISLPLRDEGRLATFKEIYEQFYKEKGYLFAIVDSLPCMYKPVKRIDSKTLELGGKVFVYAELTGKSFSHFEFFSKDHEGNIYEVKHLSTKGELVFYLEHEDQLKPLKLHKYRVTGTACQVHAIGIMEPFKIKIDAQNSDDARERTRKLLYSQGREHDPDSIEAEWIGNANETLKKAGEL